jgi:hypothetical protein
VSQVLEEAGQYMPAGGATCVVTAAPDAGLPGAVALLRRQQVHVAVAVLDAISFDPRAPGFLAPAALEAAGARVATIRRGDRIEAPLKGVFLANH